MTRPPRRPPLFPSPPLSLSVNPPHLEMPCCLRARNGGRRAFEGRGEWWPGASKFATRRGPWYREKATSRKADRKSTRLNSSHLVISYAVFCLKKKKQITKLTQQRCVRVTAIINRTKARDFRYSITLGIIEILTTAGQPHPLNPIVQLIHQQDK